MGLCKCRKVTSLYCFVHRQHVCHHCIDGHSLCHISTYLKWVQDSDYTWPPNCKLCHTEVKEGDDNIRLLCLDLYHFRCLDQYCAGLPKNTTPAGYACPSCQIPVYPTGGDNKTNTPFVSALKKRLDGTGWAGAARPVTVAPSTSPPMADDMVSGPASGRANALPSQLPVEGYAGTPVKARFTPLMLAQGPPPAEATSLNAVWPGAQILSSRKAHAPAAIIDAEEHDKYKPKGLEEDAYAPDSPGRTHLKGRAARVSQAPVNVTMIIIGVVFVSVLLILLLAANRLKRTSMQ